MVSLTAAAGWGGFVLRRVWHSAAGRDVPRSARAPAAPILALTTEALVWHKRGQFTQSGRHDT